MIRTERLELRLPSEDTAGAIARYFAENREHLARWAPTWPPGFDTEAYWRQQVERARAEAEAQAAFRLFAHPLEAPGEVVGNVSLTGIARGALQQCYLGYNLAERAQGRGFAREMAAAAVAYAFDELRLHRVSASYMPINHRSGALLRDLGFEIEGYAKGYLAIAGRWEDHVATARLNPTVAP